MKLLTNLTINIQRLIFRLKRKWRIIRLEKAMRKAVTEAERLKGISGKRHYVLLIEDKYVIKNSAQIKEINKLMDRLAKLNVVSLDKHVVHRTK